MDTFISFCGSCFDNLKNHLDPEPKNTTMKKAKKLTHDYYGMSIFELEDQEWVIGPRHQMLKAATEKIKEELWAFRTEYLVNFLTKTGALEPSPNGLKELTKCIQSVQEKLCEDANPLIKALLGSNLENFVKQVIKDDGFSCLSSYDGEIRSTKEIPGLNHGYGSLCFRIN